MDSQILETFEPKSDHPSNWKRQTIHSRSTLFNAFEGRTNIVQFLQKTVHTSQVFASVKLQQRTTFKKWLRQALHCPSYSTLVTRSLRIHRYWTLFLVQKNKTHSTALIVSVQNPWRVVRAHVQWNGVSKLYPVTLSNPWIVDTPLLCILGPIYLSPNCTQAILNHPDLTDARHGPFQARLSTFTAVVNNLTLY